MSRYRKAIVAAIPAVIVALKVLSDALGDGVVSSQEWIALVLAALAAVGVHQVPNDAPAGDLPDPAVSERGYGAVELVVGVLVIVVLVLLILRLA